MCKERPEAGAGVVVECGAPESGAEKARQMIDPNVFRDDAVSEETAAMYAAFRAQLAALRPQFPPVSVQAYRDASLQLAERFSGGPLYQSPKARELIVSDGVKVRVIDADQPRGAYLYIHGGGWAIGSAGMQDAQLEALANATGLTVISVDYRLAPEAPFPAPLDDCESAARWLSANAVAEFGTDRLIIGGGSAGANLALATLLRLRSSPPAVPFVGGNLLYGVYDTTLNLSRRSTTSSDLSREQMEWFADMYVPDHSRRTDPDVSPLYADLRGLPPLLLTVGTADLLLEDSLCLYVRLLAAHVPVEIQIFPGGDHGFDLMPLAIAHQANEKIAAFLTTAAREDSIIGASLRT